MLHLNALLHSLDLQAAMLPINATAVKIPGAQSAPSESCAILNDFFGCCMQLLLFGVCLSTLLLKWYIEKPRRRLLVFLMDSSKQIFGASWLHALNIIISIAFNASEVGLVARGIGDECSWYWTHLMADCTVGLVIVYCILRLSESQFGYRSGCYYGDPSTAGWQAPDYKVWGKQIAGYLAILSIKKCVVSLMIYCSLPGPLMLSTWATRWISNSKARLLFVMVLTPIVMDTFSLWVTDSFIKFRESSKKASMGLDMSAPLRSSGGDASTDPGAANYQATATTLGA